MACNIDGHQAMLIIAHTTLLINNAMKCDLLTWKRGRLLNFRSYEMVGTVSVPLEILSDTVLYSVP